MPGALPPLPISGDAAFPSLHITARVDADRLCRSRAWVIPRPRRPPQPLAAFQEHPKM